MPSWADLLRDPEFFRTAGAAAIGRRVARALLACLAEGGDLAAASAGALALKPSMATVRNAVLAAQAPDPGAALAGYLAGLDAALPALAAAGAALLPPGARVLTCSRSAAVLAALRAAAGAGNRLQVTCALGWPLAEGRAMAAEVAALGLAATLVPDAAVGAVAVDVALLGADALLADGGVVNKAGSRLVALAAARAGAPCYVLAEAAKRWPEAAPPPLETAPPAELDAPPGVAAWNPLFEVVDAALVTRVIMA